MMKKTRFPDLKKTKIKTKQQVVDDFYRIVMEGKPCCAGCDHWAWINSCTGECMKSAPVSGKERMGILGMSFNCVIPAGHILTPRDHSCGEFLDTYDWSTNETEYYE